MSLVFNTKTYTADAASSANSIPYNGPAATLAVKDRLDVSRVAPKGNSVYSGNARSRFKLTSTQTLTGAKTTTGDSIFDINTSFPLGTSDAAIDAKCDDMAALIGSASFKTSLKKQQISF